MAEDRERVPEPPTARSVYLSEFLRDRVAQQALGLLFPSMIDDAMTPDEIAVKAYELADAMLRAREVK